MNIALLIAIERYADGSLPPVSHAEHDLSEFAKALIPLGFEEIDQVVLAGALATKTIVESKVRRTLRSLGKEDHLFLYFVGRYGQVRGHSHLACFDTLASDFEATSIPLTAWLSSLRDSDSPRLVIFWDGHPLEHPLCGDAAESSEVLTQELSSFFTTSKNAVCLASCGAAESSWPVDAQQHGAWMLGVLEALQGKAPSALRPKKQITVAGLQSYLEEFLPRVLRTAFADDRPQTPTLYSTPGHAKWVVADLASLLDQQKSAGHRYAAQAGRLLLVREQSCSIRSLPGFNKKNHQVPTDASRYSQTFLAGIASSSIEEEIDQIFKGLRSEFRFKRADLNVSKPGDGTATIITPFFNYSLTMSLDPQAPSEVICHRQVSEIKDIARVLSREFAIVFDKVFDRIEFYPPVPIVLANFIDQIEDVGNSRISLDYDSAITWLHLRMQGVAGHVEVTPTKVSIVRSRPESPEQLLEAFFSMQETLRDTCELELMTLSDRSGQ